MVAITLVVLLLLPLAALATLTPWPVEIAALLLGLSAGAVAVHYGGHGFLFVAVGALPVCALLILKTIAETFDAAGQARRDDRPRRTPLPASTTSADDDWRIAA